MARITKADLEADIAMLRRSNEQLQTDNSILRTEINTYHEAYGVMVKHVSTMTVGNERLADALSHAIGFVTDRSRLVGGRKP